MLLENLQTLLQQTVTSQNVARAFMNDPKLTVERQKYYLGKWMQCADTIHLLKKIIEAAKG